MLFFEFSQTIRHTRLVYSHFSGHEDEPIEHHSETQDGYVLERFLQDDVDMTVHSRRVGVADPPKIQPVGVNL